MNHLTMDKIRRKEIFILILCLLIGFVLRFYTFDQKSLWVDEVYTFNESRYGLKEQFIHYKENPSYLQPPLFYTITNLFYPFTHPERDLRIIPLIFGTLSIPMIYLLAMLFSPSIALPCTLSLTFMTYHISLSQDGRSYSLLMFLGMAGLYFLMKHLKTSKKRYLISVAFFFVLSFYTNYTFIPFIALFQIFWFYQVDKDTKMNSPASFLFLNGLILLLCLPWIILSILGYKGQPLVATLRGDGTLGSFFEIIYNVIRDWAPHMPATILSIILLILLPFYCKIKKNALILIVVLILPIGGTYIFSELFRITHFVTSRYFINLLPLFFITLFLSLDAIEMKFERLKTFGRLKLLFVILFISSNLVILPLYYRSEKQDFRGLVNYLKGQLQEGDKIIVGNLSYFPPILHYFGAYPQNRQHEIPGRKIAGDEIEYGIGVIYQNIKFNIIYSKSHWFQYFTDGSKLWIIADKLNGKRLKEEYSCVLKGYFDGSFSNMARFPTDSSRYLFLWDPKSPDEKGIEMPIE
jgi:hypothetical protein